MANYNEDYLKFDEVFKTIKYLESLSETFIFNTYKEALLIDTEIPFPEDISQENRDMFYRLKFRALNWTRSSVRETLDAKVSSLN
jgi:hypothetical protein